MQGKERTYALVSRPGHVATIKSPTERERREISKYYARRFGPGGDMDTEWADYAVKKFVLRIDPPLEHRGVRIVTGADAAEYADEDPFVELATEVYTETSLSEGEKKPSGEPSASSEAENSTGGDGTAGNAGAQAARSIEAAG